MDRVCFALCAAVFFALHVRTWGWIRGAQQREVDSLQAREERKKISDHRPRPGGRHVVLVPLAFETYGRWGKHAVKELRRLAWRRAERSDAQSCVDPQAMQRGCLRRWRQEIAVALQLGNFAIYSSCCRGLRVDSEQHAAPDDSVGVVDDIVLGV